MTTGEHSHRSSGRAGRQAANLARHLNERHPDTVLFLARRTGGQRDATHAELLAVDDAGPTVTIDAAATRNRCDRGVARDVDREGFARSRLHGGRGLLAQHSDAICFMVMGSIDAAAPQAIPAATPAPWC
jgi:hypothetical protein